MAVANKVSTRTALETTMKSAGDHVAAMQSATDVAMMETTTLEEKLAQTEATTAKLRTAAATVAEAAQTATTAATAVEAAAQVTTQEKTTLEKKVAELEQDMVLTEVDLNKASKQVGDLVAKLLEATDEGTRLRDTIAQQNLDLQGCRALSSFVVLPFCVVCR